VHVLTAPSAQVIVLNHLENDQITRVFEGWSGRRPVQNWDEFSGMAVAFDRVPQVIREFRRTPGVLLSHMWRLGRLALADGMPRDQRWRRVSEAVAVPIWFLVGLPATTAKTLSRPLRAALAHLAAILWSRLEASLQRVR
jgi:hypothetical protein